MSRVKETCGCGAYWEGESFYRTDIVGFRAVHAACRTAIDSRDVEVLVEALRKIDHDEACCACPMQPGEKNEHGVSEAALCDCPVSQIRQALALYESQSGEEGR